MDEFTDQIREQAAVVLQLHGAKPVPEINPVVELISFLLEDGAGGIRSEVSLTTDQWLTWHELIANREEELVQVMTQILEDETVELPQKTEAMRHWAAWLIEGTLDRLQAE